MRFLIIVFILFSPGWVIAEPFSFMKIKTGMPPDQIKENLESFDLKCHVQAFLCETKDAHRKFREDGKIPKNDLVMFINPKEIIFGCNVFDGCNKSLSEIMMELSDAGIATGIFVNFERHGRKIICNGNVETSICVLDNPIEIRLKDIHR